MGVSLLIKWKFEFFTWQLWPIVFRKTWTWNGGWYGFEVAFKKQRIDCRRQMKSSQFVLLKTPGKFHNTKPIHRLLKSWIQNIVFDTDTVPLQSKHGTNSINGLACLLKSKTKQKTTPVPHHMRNPHFVSALGTNICTQGYACFVVSYTQIYTLALDTYIYYIYFFFTSTGVGQKNRFHGQMGFHGQITLFTATWVFTGTGVSLMNWFSRPRWSCIHVHFVSTAKWFFHGHMAIRPLATFLVAKWPPRLGLHIIDHAHSSRTTFWNHQVREARSHRLRNRLKLQATLSSGKNDTTLFST